MEGYDRTSYGAGFAAVYDEWYSSLSDGAETARFINRWASGLVIEFGVGTGRLASHIADSGRSVVGIDVSAPMLRRAVDRGIPSAIGDMTEPPVRPLNGAAVLIGFNTLYNLPDVRQQIRCLRQARSLIGDGGIVIIEAFVPGDDPPAGNRVEVARLDANEVVLLVSDTDPASGLVRGNHVHLRDGMPVRVRPWTLRYTTPDGLDRMAQAAGLILAERFADWDETAFDDRSTKHISVYTRAGGPTGRAA